jgi:magnesium transporter
MTIALFQKGQSGPSFVAANTDLVLTQDPILWADLVSPTADEERVIEARFGIDAPSEIERAALEESARFYTENNALVMNVTVMARIQADVTPKMLLKNGFIPHQREIVSFFLSHEALITVRTCPLRAFEVNEGRASADLSADETPGDILVSLVESLVERAADYLAATATELEALNVKVLVGHKHVSLETFLRRLGQMGAGASQTRDSLASLSRMVRFAIAHAHSYNLPLPRLTMLSTDIDTLQRQAEALKTDLTFALDATLGLVSARQNDTLKAMAIVTLIFVPPTLIASVFGMNFEAMSIFKDPTGPWWAVGGMAVSSLLIVSIARLGRWL